MSHEILMFVPLINRCTHCSGHHKVWSYQCDVHYSKSNQTLWCTSLFGIFLESNIKISGVLVTLSLFVSTDVPLGHRKKTQNNFGVPHGICERISGHYRMWSVCYYQIILQHFISAYFMVNINYHIYKWTSIIFSIRAHVLGFVVIASMILYPSGYRLHLGTDLGSTPCHAVIYILVELHEPRFIKFPSLVLADLQ